MLDKEKYKDVCGALDEDYVHVALAQTFQVLSAFCFSSVATLDLVRRHVGPRPPSTARNSCPPARRSLLLFCICLLFPCVSQSLLAVLRSHHAMLIWLCDSIREAEALHAAKLQRQHELGPLPLPPQWNTEPLHTHTTAEADAVLVLSQVFLLLVP